MITEAEDSTCRAMILVLDMILIDMNVPIARLRDLQWLSRNLGICNQSNPRFKIAKELINFLISEKS